MLEADKGAENVKFCNNLGKIYEKSEICAQSHKKSSKIAVFGMSNFCKPMYLSEMTTWKREVSHTPEGRRG